MVRLPEEYSGFDSFLEEHLKILRIIDGAQRVPVGYLHNFPDDVLTRTRSSGSLFNRDRETTTEIFENNTFIKDDPFGAGFSLPEVTVIGKRPTSSEDPFKWPFGDMPSESPKVLPGLMTFFLLKEAAVYLRYLHHSNQALCLNPKRSLRMQL